MRTSLVAVATSAMVLAACSTAPPGDPVPRPAAGNGGSQDRTITAEPTGRTSLAAVDPCGLLTPSGQSAMAVTDDGQAKERGGARYCEWRVRKDSIADSYTIAVGVWEDRGVDHAVSERAVRHLEVNSREAVEGVGAAAASCFVALAVTETSRVDAAVVGTDGEQLCPVALELAELVEPELP